MLLIARAHMLRFQLAACVAVLVCAATHAPALPSGYSAKLSPVILVPGLAGSVFEASLDNYTGPHSWCSGNTDKPFVTWVAPTQLVPIQKDCLMDRLMLHFDANTGKYHNTTGVSLNTNVDFGGSGGIAWLSPSLHIPGSAYYEPLIDYLVKLGGYKVGVNLHGAPYDWRLGPDGHSAPGQYYDKLQSLVERTFAANNQTAVTIVTHSLGGPTVLGFLRRQSSAWKKTYVRGFAPISAPFGGTGTMCLAMVSGDNFGFRFLPYDYLRPVQASAASGVFLLPDPQLYAGAGRTPILTTPEVNFTAAQMPAAMAALGLNQSSAIYKFMAGSGSSAGQIFNNSGGRGSPGVGVPTFVITSFGVKTRNAFHYSEPFRPGQAPQPASLSYGDGDGVVDDISLGWPSTSPLWEPDRTGGDPSLHFFNVSGVSHFGMVSDKRVLQYIAKTVLRLPGAAFH